MKILMYRSSGKIEMIDSNKLGYILYRTNLKDGVKVLTTKQCYAIANDFINGSKTQLQFCGRLFSK